MQTNQEQNPNDSLDTCSSVSTHKSYSEPVYHQNNLIKSSLDVVWGLKLYLPPDVMKHQNVCPQMSLDNKCFVFFRII